MGIAMGVKINPRITALKSGQSNILMVIHRSFPLLFSVIHKEPRPFCLFKIVKMDLFCS